jgi:hypothetical protein
MHNARPSCPTGIRQILKVKKQSMDHRTRPGACSGVDYNSRRFLDHCKILVLEVDLERHLLGSRWLTLEQAEVDFDCFTSPDLVSGFIQTTVDSDSAAAVEQLNLGAGKILYAPGKKNIEAQTSIISLGLELHFE